MVNRSHAFLVPGLLTALFMLSVDPAPLRAEYRPLDLTFVGLSYGAPMRPPELAEWVDDGFGVRGQLDIRPVRSFAICLGAERMRFYKPGQFHFIAGTVDASLKFILPPFLGGVGYLQTGAGFNVLGDQPNTWGGSTCGRVIVGKKLEVARGFAFDLSAGYHTMGRPEAFKYVDARLGMSIGIGRDKGPKPKETPKPAVSPSATVPTVPTAEASPKPPKRVRTPKGSPTPMGAHTATPTPNVITLSEDVPTFTPTPRSVPVTVAVVEKATATPTITHTPSKAVIAAANKTMRETYDAGIAAYKAGKYRTALATLKRALAIRDSTQFWYYAEANAMIGVIYHHKLKPANLKLAAQYYRAALKVDPATATAKKGLAKIRAASKPVR